jgi:hypothetical protein
MSDMGRASNFDGVFPFGRPSTKRPARRPTSGSAEIFVLGVYPSALHVRWILPQWLCTNDRSEVKALAVDVEPTVFWDGSDAAARVEQWREVIGFREGNGLDDWGFVEPAARNGSSGDDVGDRVLKPLGKSPASTWFTDAVPWFFVKRAPKTSAKIPSPPSQQADVLDDVYTRLVVHLAKRGGHLPKWDLPSRPSIAQLVDAASDRSAELRDEVLASRAATLITLGEEARRVATKLADEPGNVSSIPLSLAMSNDDYATKRELMIGDQKVNWWALRHPGSRDRRWQDKDEAWRESARSDQALNVRPC